MRRLIIMRHAKSSWDDPGLDDHDRPLNGRGRMAATLMGAWLAEAGLLPDHVLCSSALRARQTWDLVARGAGLESAVPVTETRDLYLAEPETALAVLRRTPAEASQALLIGHEPGLTAFLRKLSAGEIPAGCARAFEKFPTAAVAALDFAEARDWGAIDFGAAAFRQFARPKDLV